MAAPGIAAVLPRPRDPATPAGSCHARGSGRVEGRVKVAGLSPKVSGDIGTVEVARTVDKTNKVTGMIGAKASIGTGIRDGKNTVAVGHLNNDSYGIRLVVPKGDDAETWTREQHRSAGERSPCGRGRAHQSHARGGFRQSRARARHPSC